MFNNWLSSDDNPIGFTVDFGDQPETNLADFMYQDLIAVTIDAIKEFLVTATVHLFRAGEIVPGKNTTIEELEAAECDFSGYAPVTVTAWKGPYNAISGGQYIETGLIIFAGTSASPFVGNSVAGYWVESQGNQLEVAGTFDSEVPVASAGDAVQCNVQIPYGVPVAAA